MKHSEVAGFVRELMQIYPNWTPADLDEQINVWAKYLGPYMKEDVEQAFRDHMKTDKRGFIPSLSVLVNRVEQVRETHSVQQAQTNKLLDAAKRECFAMKCFDVNPRYLKHLNDAEIEEVRRYAQEVEEAWKIEQSR